MLTNDIISFEQLGPDLHDLNSVDRAIKVQTNKPTNPLKTGDP